MFYLLNHSLIKCIRINSDDLSRQRSFKNYLLYSFIPLRRQYYLLFLNDFELKSIIKFLLNEL